MKKVYMTPCMKQEMAEFCSMLAQSGVNSSNGIGYGGIDNNGNKDPEVKEFLWDEPGPFDN